MHDQSWLSSEQTHQSSNGPGPKEQERKVLVYTFGVYTIDYVMSIFLAKIQPTVRVMIRGGLP